MQKFMSGESLYLLHFKKQVQNETQNVFVTVKMVHTLSSCALYKLMTVISEFFGHEKQMR